MALTDDRIENSPLEINYDIKKAENAFIQAVRIETIVDFLEIFSKELEYQVLPNIPQDTPNRDEHIIGHIRERMVQIRRHYQS